MMYKFIQNPIGAALCCGLLLATACSPRVIPSPDPAAGGQVVIETPPPPGLIETRFDLAKIAAPALQPGVAQSRNATCNDWSNYAPDPAHPEHFPQRYVRINVHIIDKDPAAPYHPVDSVRLFVKDLLRYANGQLDTNVWNWRSVEGTPVLPKRYRYVLTPQPGRAGDDGIYFHYDEKLCPFVSQGREQNNYSTEVVQRYAIGLDSILNIFIQRHHPDSCRSKTYRSGGQGIALGMALKMAGMLEGKKLSPGNFVGLLNHEIGHIFNLNHAWMEDGCPDTQDHPNRCWNWTPTGPCRDLATNNMMDYNADQIALTPCQLGRIHLALSNEMSDVRACLKPVWCTRLPEHTITVRDSVVWMGARDFSGDIVIAPGGSLRLACRASIPPGGRITVQPGGALWLDGCRLHNACGKRWDGVYIQEKDGVKGRVGVLEAPVVENLRF